MSKYRYQYYQLDIGDKYLYIKAISKKKALDKIIKVLNPPKEEYITILNDLEEIDKDTYNLHSSLNSQPAKNMKKYKYYKYKPSIYGYITWYLKTTSEKEAIRIIELKCNMEGIPFYHHHLQPITPSQYNAYLIYLRSNLPL